jgi:phage-related protein
LDKGFDVGGPDALAEWKTKLAVKDLGWRPGSKGECLERQVADFIEFKDPDGHPLALSSVYTLKYADVVFLLHAFQKKSKTGRETPRRDIELIKQRLREAERIAKEMMA